MVDGIGKRIRELVRRSVEHRQRGPSAERPERSRGQDPPDGQRHSKNGTFFDIGRTGLLGLALRNLAGMARRAGDRPTRNRHPLASSG